MAIAPGDTGCGRGIQGFPEIIPLAGWTNTNVAIGDRDLGAGRLGLTEHDG